MRYWNKQKAARKNWTMVKVGIDWSRLPANNWNEMKLWCQRSTSRARFYSGPYTSSYWYFESSEDALAFKLKWATNGSR
jgi:hypothetical protein